MDHVKVFHDPVRQHTLQQRGFSVIEMLVTIAIFTMMSTLLLINHNTVESRIEVDNRAHEIAQWIRESQIYAMGVKSSATTANTAFVTGYGIHFAPAQSGNFVLFADRGVAPDHTYDTTGTCGSDTAECSKVITLPKNLKVESIRGVLGGVTTALDNLDITFLRPNPDAFIYGNTGGAYTGYEKGEITIVSAKGLRRTIDIWSTGQISVR